MLYMAKWFKTEAEAKQFQKEHDGVLYKNVPRSRTKRKHIETAAMIGFDPEVFRYSVSWNERDPEKFRSLAN